MWQVIRDCNKCKREKARRYAKAPTVSLLKFRVKPATPFSQTALDFARLLFVKTSEGMKMLYILLFTCALTQAVHLELVQDQSAATLTQALWNFQLEEVCQRGFKVTIQKPSRQQYNG